MPAELAKDYDALVAFLRRTSREWPSSDGLHREPGSPRSDTIVMLDAATLEGRALLGASAVKAFVSWCSRVSTWPRSRAREGEGVAPAMAPGLLESG